MKLRYLNGHFTSSTPLTTVPVSLVLVTMPSGELLRMSNEGHIQIKILNLIEFNQIDNQEQ